MRKSSRTADSPHHRVHQRTTSEEASWIAKRHAIEPGFPDLSITVDDMIAEGDRVACRVVMRGTHTGEFQGLAPTGKRVEVGVINMFRISGGKIVEHWGHADDPTDFLRQPECS